MATTQASKTPYHLSSTSQYSTAKIAMNNANTQLIKYHHMGTSASPVSSLLGVLIRPGTASMMICGTLRAAAAMTCRCSKKHQTSSELSVAKESPNMFKAYVIGIYTYFLIVSIDDRDESREGHAPGSMQCISGHQSDIHSPHQQSFSLCILHPCYRRLGSSEMACS